MPTAAYYNEFDPYAAQWLRNLIAAGHIAPGDVDERSIAGVHPVDLIGYTQAHFFAGIGGWSLALRLAGWPDDRAAWTGSCPCQPFSAAGKHAGFADDRHLWPEFFRLIRQHRPSVVFGEQVASGAAWPWLDLVSGDLEGEGYAFGAADLPACSVGAPHRRQRLWWVAHTEHSERRSLNVHREDGRDGSHRGRQEAHGEPGARGQVRGERMGDASRPGLAQQRSERGTPRGPARADEGQAAIGADASTPWHDLEWLPCSDGKARPTQPGLFPLAHGIPNRVGRLRAYGNAIVPQVAAEFVLAVMSCRP